MSRINFGVMSSNRDDWETPQSLFDALNGIYDFTLDPCSTHGNAKCERHYTREDDGLSKSWAGERVFCNPPYAAEGKRWIAKCAEESKHAMVMALLPARTDVRAFHQHIYNRPNVRIWFLRGRLKFELGGGSLRAARRSRRCWSHSDGLATNRSERRTNFWAAHTSRPLLRRKR